MEAMVAIESHRPEGTFALVAMFETHSARDVWGSQNERMGFCMRFPNASLVWLERAFNPLFSDTNQSMC